MAEWDEIFHSMNKRAEVQLLRIPEECEKTLEWLKSYREEILNKMKQMKEAASNESYSVPILPKTPSRHNRPKRLACSSSSSNEENTSNKTNNQPTDITDSSINSSKPKRNACLLAEKKINIQSQIKLNSKMRRPGKDKNTLNDISNNTAALTIKSEKVSASPLKDPIPPIELKQEAENIKKENMPPPVAKPRRVRKKVKKEVVSSDTENESIRVTRSKRGGQSSESEKSKKGKTTRRNSRPDSDVILQEVPVPLVIVDSEDDVTSQNETEINTKDSRKIKETPADDEPVTEKKKTKKKVEKKTKKTEQKKQIPDAKDDSLYEDALPVVSKDVGTSKDILSMMNCVVNLESVALNGTHIVEKELNVTHVKSPALNQTHILPSDINKVIKTPNGVQNCTVVLQKLDETVSVRKSDAIVNQTVVLTPKENNHQWQKPDILPIADNILTDDDSILKETPEKKREPPRKGVKTKQMFSPYANSPVKKRVAAFEKLVQNDPDQSSRVTRTKTRNLEKKENQTSTESAKAPVKSKYFTPTINKLPSLIPQSDSKISRPGIILPTKSASAIKLSRTELQLRREEEQKKRLEKEQEVKRKREAIMQAKAEEQRKKREEKQMKVQKAREELEREKEEKLRQLLQEKEEEQKKKREYQVKKLAEIEERKRLEAEQLKFQEKLRQLEEKKKKQHAQLPPLPTEDWEDSGSESDQPVYRKPKYQKPDWALTKNLYRTLLVQNIISKTYIIKEWYHMQATTPDLQEMFENVDERYLRRNSSAVWRTPPRYSKLPKY